MRNYLYFWEAQKNKKKKQKKFFSDFYFKFLRRGKVSRKIFCCEYKHRLNGDKYKHKHTFFGYKITFSDIKFYSFEHQKNYKRHDHG